MTANESTQPIGGELSDLWASADENGCDRADTLRFGREAYLRGEIPDPEWGNTLGGVMSRSRWMRRQLERERMGLPFEEFVMGDWIDDVEADLRRLAGRNDRK